jgi:putative protease
MAEGEKLIGRVAHFFTSINVGVIELKGRLKVGDEIRIKGATTDLTQKVGSMQIDRKPVESAGKGDSIGLKVADRVREGDKVFKVA